MLSPSNSVLAPQASLILAKHILLADVHIISSYYCTASSIWSHSHVIYNEQVELYSKPCFISTPRKRESLTFRFLHLHYFQDTCGLTNLVGSRLQVRCGVAWSSKGGITKYLKWALLLNIGMCISLKLCLNWDCNQYRCLTCQWDFLEWLSIINVLRNLSLAFIYNVWVSINK